MAIFFFAFSLILLTVPTSLKAQEPTNIVLEVCPLFCECFHSNASLVCSVGDGHFPADISPNTQAISLRLADDQIRFLFLHDKFFTSQKSDDEIYSDDTPDDIQPKDKDAPDHAYPLLRQFEVTTGRSVLIRLHQGALARRRFPALEHLKLTGGKLLPPFPANFLQDAPSLVTLDLHGLQIVELGAGTFAPVGNSLEILNLSQNNLTSIESELFLGLSVLSRLDLSFNAIKQISANAFSNLIRLNELLLQGNAIVVPGFSDSLPTTLTMLDISSNPISSLPREFFHKANRISILRMNNLRLTESTIQRLADTLDPLTRTLKVLTLDYSLNSTDRNVLTSQLFHRFDLELLSLAGNRLVSMDFALKDGGIAANSLILDDNNIAEICPSNWATVATSPGAIKTRFLSLVQNNISRLDEEQIKCFPLLKHLNLSMNHISTISDNALASLLFLQVLDISNNSLQELTRTAFLPSASQTSNGATLRLNQLKLAVNGNPLHCNADLLWLKELYMRQLDRFSYFDNSGDLENVKANHEKARCATPHPPAAFYTLQPANFRSFQPTARILTMGAKNFSAGEGERINLTCEVFGDPSPQVIWSIPPDRKSIFPPTDVAERRRIVQLVLNNVQSVNEGQITCTATNRLGSHMASAHLVLDRNQLSWESIVDITLTAFVSCFVTVVLVALVTWACVTRRRTDSSADGSPDGRSGRKRLCSRGNASNGNASSPSTGDSEESPCMKHSPKNESSYENNPKRINGNGSIKMNPEADKLLPSVEVIAIPQGMSSVVSPIGLNLTSKNRCPSQKSSTLLLPGDKSTCSGKSTTLTSSICSSTPSASNSPPGSANSALSAPGATVIAKPLPPLPTQQDSNSTRRLLVLADSDFAPSPPPPLKLTIGESRPATAAKPQSRPTNNRFFGGKKPSMR